MSHLVAELQDRVAWYESMLCPPEAERLGPFKFARNSSARLFNAFVRAGGRLSREGVLVAASLRPLREADVDQLFDHNTHLPKTYVSQLRADLRALGLSHVRISSVYGWGYQMEDIDLVRRIVREVENVSL